MPIKPNALDQNCAARQTLDLIADKWTVLLIYALAEGTKRYNELSKMIEGVTPKMLTQTLRRMETSGIVYRTVHPVSPPKVEYSLTPLGETLIVPLTALCRWAEDHANEVETLQQNYFVVENLKAEL
jgi:DNA-binding HxlR family transcriptional regulator